ncbi:MAG: LPS-assembly protein LptD [Hydrogenophaga sp.]
MTVAAPAGAGTPAALAWGAAVACVALWAGAAHAQTETPLRLRLSSELLEALPEADRSRTPSFVSGERLSGQTDGTVVVEGEAQWRRHGLVIKADRLEYDQQSREAKAQGQVLVNRAGNRFEGPELQLNVDSGRGYFEQPRFSLLQNEGLGEARRVDFLDQDRLEAHDARYSTCPRPSDGAWKPDWEVRARHIELDNASEVGVAHGGVLAFQGVPVLGAPYLSFPLTDQRKSGVLPPTINIDNVSGLELTLPYYLNLAPQFDATLYPTVMSQRGLDMGGELRYLQPGFGGQWRASFMPDDRLRQQDRWGYALQHQHSVATTEALAGLGLHSPLGLRLNLNRVSDDNYWRDFPRSGSSLTSRLLANEAVLNWNQGPWSLHAGAYRWQTLQDVAAPIVPPYDRLPSVALRHGREHQAWAGLRGWWWSLLADHTRFQSDPARTLQPNGTRGLAVARVGHRWETPGWFLAPTLQLHHASYRFDTPTTGGALNASRSLPTFSIDSGLVFERDTRFFGRPFVQTLEPRAFFTWTPTRWQGDLPNYDSAANDFNFASVYTENTFGGNDRLADLRALTVGASSRLLDPASGAEVVRLGLAQRYLLRDQSVVLPNCGNLAAAGCQPVTNRLSDVLLGARVQWSPRWATDANVQFSPQENTSVRTTLRGRYTPSAYRVFSAAYRLQRGSSEQLDVGWQWPLSDWWARQPADVQPGRALGPQQWYSVGRINYSVTDRRIVDLVAGIEYDAGCWIGRAVFERLTTGLTTANQRVLFQVEFSGFSRIGSNPLQTLRNNVPRYQYLREDINPPSRFQQYD